MPTPRKKRPGIIAATVAAAWATIAGCVRIVGHVTAVPTPTRSVACAIAPSTAHTNGDSPWRVVHGWKWSETVTKSKPASSARIAVRTRKSGGCSSADRCRPTRTPGPVHWRFAIASASSSLLMLERPWTSSFFARS